MLGVGEEGELDLNTEAMVKYEDVFLERKEQLRRALDRITSKPLDTRQEEIVRMLNVALSGTGDSDEEFQEAMIAYIQMIMIQDERAADRLLEHDASPEYIRFVLNSIIDYGGDMQRLNFRSTQGDRWWSFVDLDRIIKDDGIKHHHKITIDKKEKVEIHSTPHSDWTLIRHLLDSVYDSYYFSNEDRLNLMNIDVFEQVRAYVYAFESDLKDNNIELADREDLLESDSKPDQQEDD